jgi:hypothetical protein
MALAMAVLLAWLMKNWRAELAPGQRLEHHRGRGGVHHRPGAHR